jgi:2-C-methyl-D-erythritol 4-phosphate cytidylyltransferase/2-C-methyl-D-erythritol 2,4-cyclodiphosphate synthase
VNRTDEGAGAPGLEPPGSDRRRGWSAADAIVVAAGSSQRMGGLDKVLAPLGGRPLLAWSLEAMRAALSVRRLIVVTRADRVAELQAARWVRAVDAEVIAGGRRRQESAAAGVRHASADVVLVHEAARPFATPALADRVAEVAAAHGAAIPVLAIADTIKRVVDGRIVGTIDRTGVAAAQTPQGARRALLLDAYRRHDPGGPAEFTDDAALLQADGVPVIAVEGEPSNLKVTFPDDLRRAEASLVASPGSVRTGLGTDRHPFGPEDGLALGGITMPDAPRLHGHSDGDVALHAIADAILGVAGLGDLGRLFPAGAADTRGIASGSLVAEVVARAGAAGWVPIAVDLTLTGARPRFGARRLDAMRAAIAELMGLDVTAVAVKASTGNLSGDEGAGRVIAATALVTLLRPPRPDRTMAT